MSLARSETTRINTDIATILEDLPRAIANDELTIFYQPQVSADGQTIASVEALARWTHPVAGPVSPAAFIPFAEENGLIDTLGLAVLRRACRQAVEWPQISVAVNVSPLQFASADLLSMVDEAIRDARLPEHRLELEITEGTVFADPVGAKRTMEQLRARGIRLALDDFGTGFASLSYLRTLPWDKVKIDKSFVDDVSFVTSAAIVHAVVALCRAIGLKVTAEGIETADQQRFLRLAGCHYLQGYRFSPPVPAERIGLMLREGMAANAAR